MHQFASEVSQLVHSLAAGAELAEKIASDAGSIATQSVVSEGADGVYSVIIKEAQEVEGELPHHAQVVRCITKMAEALGKPAPSAAQCSRLAAVVIADNALSEATKTASSGATQYDNMRRYGREFFVHLLKDIL